MPRPSNPFQLHHSNYTWRRVQVKRIWCFILFFALRREFNELRKYGRSGKRLRTTGLDKWLLVHNAVNLLIYISTMEVKVSGDWQKQRNLKTDLWMDQLDEVHMTPHERSMFGIEICCTYVNFIVIGIFSRHF
jgi:hypothetical protein